MQFWSRMVSKHCAIKLLDRKESLDQHSLKYVCLSIPNVKPSGSTSSTVAAPATSVNTTNSDSGAMC